MSLPGNHLRDNGFMDPSVKNCLDCLQPQGQHQERCHTALRMLHETLKRVWSHEKQAAWHLKIAGRIFASDRHLEMGIGENTPNVPPGLPRTPTDRAQKVGDHMSCPNEEPRVNAYERGSPRAEPWLSDWMSKLNLFKPGFQKLATDPCVNMATYQDDVRGVVDRRERELLEEIRRLKEDEA